MKRFTLLLALSSTLFAGCTKVSTEEPQERLQRMTFSASSSEEPEARATIDGLEIKWTARDKIAIFDGTAVREFTLKSGAGTTSAVFEGEASPAESYIAVYPYSEDITVGSKGEIHGLNIPHSQTAGAAPVIMTARCEDGSNTFAFKNALAYMKVTPRFDCHKIVFETYEADGDGNDLCGEAEIASLSAHVVGNACSHVILCGDIKAGSTYLVGVAPKHLSKGFKVIFDDAVNTVDIMDHGLQYIRMSGKTTDLFRGHVLNLGEFSKNATDWTENGVDLASFETEGQDTEHYDYRSVYDWKDVVRIASCCNKMDTLKTSMICFQDDIDFGGSRVLYPSVFNVRGGNVSLCGNGHKISNYIQGGITVDNEGHAGLFMVKRLRSFYVEGLSLYPKSFDVSGSSILYGGAFVSKCYCTESIMFKDCCVSGDLRVTCTDNAETYAGGFVGMMDTYGKMDLTNDTPAAVSFDNCLMEGSVTAYSEDDVAYAGGIAAYILAPNYDFICSITRCRNKADIFAEGDDDSWELILYDAVSAGGIVGCDRDIANDLALRMDSCVNEGSVKAHAMDNNNAHAGGMIGLHDSDGSNIDEIVHPYVYNCLNRGYITATSDDGIAAGIIGYCYDDDTTFRNCVDDGAASGEECAHISGTSGSYGSPCFWTKSDSYFGILEKKDRDGYRASLSVDDLNSGSYDAKWVIKDGHLDLDF